MCRPNDQRVALGLVAFPSNSVFSVVLHTSLRGQVITHPNYQAGADSKIQDLTPLSDPTVALQERFAASNSLLGEREYDRVLWKTKFLDLMYDAFLQREVWRFHFTLEEERVQFSLSNGGEISDGM